MDIYKERGTLGSLEDLQTSVAYVMGAGVATRMKSPEKERGRERASKREREKERERKREREREREKERERATVREIQLLKIVRTYTETTVTYASKSLGTSYIWSESTSKKIRIAV